MENESRVCRKRREVGRWKIVFTESWVHNDPWRTAVGADSWKVRFSPLEVSGSYMSPLDVSSCCLPRLLHQLMLQTVTHIAHASIIVTLHSHYSLLPLLHHPPPPFPPDFLLLSHHPPSLSLPSSAVTLAFGTSSVIETPLCTRTCTSIKSLL